MADLPTRSFRIGYNGFDITLSDRALVRACYRCYASESKAVARWVASELAQQIERIRIANQDEAFWRDGWRKQEARRG